MAQTDQPTYYDVLGVDREASDEDIRRAATGAQHRPRIDRRQERVQQHRPRVPKFSLKDFCIR